MYTGEKQTCFEYCNEQRKKATLETKKKVKSECIDLFPSNDNPQAHSENEKEKNSMHKPTMK